MKLELAVLAGAESKEFLVKLTQQIDRLEKIVSTVKGMTVKGEVEIEEIDEDDDTVDEEEDEFTPAKKKPKKKTFEDDEDEEKSEDENEDDEQETEDDESEDEEVEEDEAPVKGKKGKAKKITVDDCNDAAKALAKSIGGKPGREKVLGLMKKHFKTESVAELKPEQYEKFVSVMQKAME